MRKFYMKRCNCPLQHVPLFVDLFWCVVCWLLNTFFGNWFFFHLHFLFNASSTSFSSVLVALVRHNIKTVRTLYIDTDHLIVIGSSLTAWCACFNKNWNQNAKKRLFKKYHISFITNSVHFCLCERKTYNYLLILI